MAIIDLSEFNKIEPLEFICPDGKTYTIPATLSTDLVDMHSKYVDQISNLNNDEVEALKLTKKMVVDILNLDKTKSVNLSYVNKNLNDIRILKIIIDESSKFITELTRTNKK